jgi:hypothetical protein
MSKRVSAINAPPGHGTRDETHHQPKRDRAALTTEHPELGTPPSRQISPLFSSFVSREDSRFAPCMEKKKKRVVKGETLFP